MVRDTGLEPVTSCVSATFGKNAEKLKKPFISGLLPLF